MFKAVCVTLAVIGAMVALINFGLFVVEGFTYVYEATR